ncbi:Transcription factor [Mycena venus]|uniref:Transcription factor n=1 Tax=Mycena venus TaxID=2733690 RepID=A0A8H6Z1B0_9AGAR|nr:Transcription factor [Mycena venus]
MLPGEDRTGQEPAPIDESVAVAIAVNEDIQPIAILTTPTRASRFPGCLREFTTQPVATHEAAQPDDNIKFNVPPQSPSFGCHPPPALALCHGPPPPAPLPRRANTAERRATHNAVEKMRRETLNGRFLTLASPSSTHVAPPPEQGCDLNTARQHRVLGAQKLRASAREAEGLRRVSSFFGIVSLRTEEGRRGDIITFRLWTFLRKRTNGARVLQLNVPVRSEAHQVVLGTELEDFDLTLEDGPELKSGDEGGRNEAESPSPVAQQVLSPTASSPHEQLAGFSAPVPSTPAQCFVFDVSAPPALTSAASSTTHTRMLQVRHATLGWASMGRGVLCLEAKGWTARTAGANGHGHGLGELQFRAPHVPDDAGAAAGAGGDEAPGSV